MDPYKLKPAPSITEAIKDAIYESDCQSSVGLIAVNTAPIQPVT
jgi:hypothetical protein